MSTQRKEKKKEAPNENGDPSNLKKRKLSTDLNHDQGFDNGHEIGKHEEHCRGGPLLQKPPPPLIILLQQFVFL